MTPISPYKKEYGVNRNRALSLICLNNHAEQQIRPDVIFRKITNGNRSIEGAENHSVVMTILQTAKLNNMDPITTLEKILLQNKENPFSKILSPPKKSPPSYAGSNIEKRGALAYSLV